MTYEELHKAYEQLLLDLSIEIQRREDMQKAHAREMKYVSQKCDELQASLAYLATLV